MLTVLAAALLTQLTTIQLAPISVTVSPGLLEFDGPCRQLTGRHTLATNVGRDTVVISTSLVGGDDFKDFIEGLPSGALLLTAPQESQDREVRFRSFTPTRKRAHLDLLSRYHQSAIDRERARIEQVAARALRETELDLRDLEEEAAEDAAAFPEQEAQARRRHRDLVDRQTPKLNSSNAELSSLRDEYEEKRQQYLRGEFCTGCGRTRSDIEGAGERFPHQGQSIRKASPEELARLEREYDQKISRASSKSRDLAREIEQATRQLNSRLEELAGKRERLKALTERHMAKLQEELKAIAARKQELLSQLAELAGKTVTTRIELVGQCTQEQGP